MESQTNTKTEQFWLFHMKDLGIFLTVWEKMISQCAIFPTTNQNLATFESDQTLPVLMKQTQRKQNKYLMS